MQPFSYVRPDTIDEALRLGSQPGARYIGGGTNLIDLVKAGVEAPQRLVDVSRLPLAQVEALPDGGLRIGAMLTNTDAANQRLVRERYPLLAQALLSGASGQLRNMATVGGNLLQRTRCHYFYDTGFPACNKRKPGSGCGARDGINRMHAILGASEHCIAVHPSDMCVALAALEAVIVVRAPGGERRIRIADFHRLPEDKPEIDTTLAPGELVVALELPSSPYAAHAHYLKVRDRASFAFALVSVAAALEFSGHTVRSARLALGGVAHKPWRVPAAEQALTGRPLSAHSAAEAARLLLDGARSYEHNAFKVGLAQRAVVRALQVAARPQGA
ncbi:FAD binding domain-containing protein [Cupriavidus oxalaticus]|uniref:Oxidoreductase with FAD-binding domain n=1 Tax=Cupriavidus oxalaticus TaxID=96344 RepID=A0A976GC39_9BURK|nr:xanthine dehydrogenase family protein subunit M [Cupriavidus oxalaticus]QRQ83699.1 xanthine dehydrogenase family protein subunit M [Cupriavidus oxalaticus]QRQ92212.1 xanthine dehydrogenase family protein subunit M [Cupriavidus oxalaticus]WQD86821.1 xanthine dehydrogenase family protein subunit M [Cupriavidus oxalaticus]SPC19117.1 putative oxidoreductase with FAD-binding domain [Cupriavidus oxalaticus]